MNTPLGRLFGKSRNHFLSRLIAWRVLAALLFVGVVLTVWIILSQRLIGDDENGNSSIFRKSKAERVQELQNKRPSNPTKVSFLTQPDHQKTYQLYKSKLVNYGSGIGQVGLVRNSEVSSIGPESFGFDGDGNLVIGDLVNQRILFFSENGEFISQTNLPGVSINEFFVDESRNIYVYSQTDENLVQYNSNGTTIFSLSVSGLIDTRGYFHLVGNSVYHADACEQDVLIGIIEEGILRAPKTTEIKRREGIVTESGSECVVRISRSMSVSMSVHSPNEERTLEYEIGVPGVVSARFIGEDEEQNRYVQIEQIREGTDHQISLSVIKFRGNRTHSIFECAENDYKFWTSKLLAVRKDGAVLQFLPQEGQAKINIYMNP